MGAEEGSARNNEHTVTSVSAIDITFTVSDLLILYPFSLLFLRTSYALRYFLRDAQLPIIPVRTPMMTKPASTTVLISEKGRIVIISIPDIPLVSIYLYINHTIRYATPLESRPIIIPSKMNGRVINHPDAPI